MKILEFIGKGSLSVSTAVEIVNGFISDLETRTCARHGCNNNPARPPDPSLHTKPDDPKQNNNMSPHVHVLFESLELHRDSKSILDHVGQRSLVVTLGCVAWL